MKITPLFVLLACFVFIGTLWAQKSPELLVDGRVTFRLKADKAETVKVYGQFGDDVFLTKGNDGVWTGTTPTPVPSGIHEYSFVVDGLTVVDQRSPQVKPQHNTNTSYLHIPNDPLAPWDLAKIPHGALHLHDYYSESLQQWRHLVVYTPPCYERSKPLPVLYLSHGYIDNEYGWTTVGKAHWIMDSLLNAGKIPPMIIVMPDAHTSDPEGLSYQDFAAPNNGLYAKDLVNDTIPFIEANYAVKPDPEHRAFAGLSMGGGHALYLTQNHPDLFSSIGAFSASPPIGQTLNANDAKRINDQVDLLWVACGDNDFLFERNQQLHAQLEALNISHQYLITPGDNHSWPVWRRYLVKFLQELKFPSK